MCIYLCCHVSWTSIDFLSTADANVTIHAWFLSDAQIPELEDVSEEGVEHGVNETEGDSDEDVGLRACAHSSCST